MRLPKLPCHCVSLGYTGDYLRIKGLHGALNLASAGLPQSHRHGYTLQPSPTLPAARTFSSVIWRRGSLEPEFCFNEEWLGQSNQAQGVTIRFRHLSWLTGGGRCLTIAFIP